MIKHPNREPYEKNRFIIPQGSLSGAILSRVESTDVLGAAELAGRLLQGSFLHVSGPQQRRPESWAQLTPPDAPHLRGLPSRAASCEWAL